MAVPGVGPSVSPTAAAAVQPASPSKGGGFAELIQQQLQQVNQHHRAADQAITDLTTGQSENVHDVVMAVTKADLAFRMVLEIRNKVIDSYQEIMRMQV